MSTSEQMYGHPNVYNDVWNRNNKEFFRRNSPPHFRNFPRPVYHTYHYEPPPKYPYHDRFVREDYSYNFKRQNNHRKFSRENDDFIPYDRRPMKDLRDRNYDHRRNFRTNLPPEKKEIKKLEIKTEKAPDLLNPPMHVLETPKTQPIQTPIESQIKEEPLPPQIPQTNLTLSQENTTISPSSEPVNLTIEVLQKIEEKDNEIQDLENELKALQNKRESLTNPGQAIEKVLEKLEPLEWSFEEDPQFKLILDENRQNNSSLIIDSGLLPLEKENVIYNSPQDYPNFLENEKSFESNKDAYLKIITKRKQSLLHRHKKMMSDYTRHLSEWNINLQKLEEEKEALELQRETEGNRRTRGGRLIPVRASVRRTEEALKKKQTYSNTRTNGLAEIPPLMVNDENPLPNFIDENRLHKATLEEHLLEHRGEAIWYPEEVDLFIQLFKQNYKKFNVIAKQMPNKTLKDCIQFYYTNKKKLNLKKTRRETGRKISLNVRSEYPNTRSTRRKPISRSGGEGETSRWTEKDRQNFLEAFKIYHKDFKAIMSFVKTKNLSQIKNFYHNNKFRLGFENLTKPKHLSDMETTGSVNVGEGPDHDDRLDQNSDSDTERNMKEESEEFLKEPTPPPEPPKKKRGRPRKVPLPPEQVTTQKNKPITPAPTIKKDPMKPKRAIKKTEPKKVTAPNKSNGLRSSIFKINSEEEFPAPPVKLKRSAEDSLEYPKKVPKTAHPQSPQSQLKKIISSPNYNFTNSEYHQPEPKGSTILYKPANSKASIQSLLTTSSPPNLEIASCLPWNKN